MRVRDEGTFSASEHTTKLCHFRRRFLLLLRTERKENPGRRSAYMLMFALFLSVDTLKSLRMTSSNIYFSVIRRAYFLTLRNFAQKESMLDDAINHSEMRTKGKKPIPRVGVLRSCSSLLISWTIRANGVRVGGQRIRFLMRCCAVTLCLQKA
jgi:hypothetical protein